jgi:hypothetical protein
MLFRSAGLLLGLLMAGFLPATLSPKPRCTDSGCRRRPTRLPSPAQETELCSIRCNPTNGPKTESLAVLKGNVVLVLSATIDQKLPRSRRNN